MCVRERERVKNGERNKPQSKSKGRSSQCVCTAVNSHVCTVQYICTVYGLQLYMHCSKNTDRNSDRVKYIEFWHSSCPPNTHLDTMNT